jgi:hypothetical protein
LFEDDDVNQIFEDHIPFILGGLVVTTGLLAVRRQTKWGKRLSKTAFILACIYPCAIIGLFLGRMHLGESYAYLIFGDLVAMLLAIIAGIIVLAWIPVYVSGIRRKKAA